MKKAYLPIPPLTEKDKARFWSKVEKTETCWIWRGTRNDKTYGVISLGGRKGGRYRAHRVAYSIAFGSTPVDLEVIHVCDNPWCLRHITLGTHAENMQDMRNKGRHAHGKEFGEIVKKYGRKGQDRPESKLSDETVLEIRRLLQAGALGKDLAKQHNVNESCISKIKNRRQWTHI